ncbi:MAG TPA: molybdenum cofactor guanylyltransferase MobA [Methylophilaceae bacterium]|nr:molybdenum cofactor guanylyltransferase MobA [Methylophilaceae bacterium]HQR61038.1 molybdenum cofactor guanylyltransferase MobA [Methylophilaceae bacterium]
MNVTGIVLAGGMGRRMGGVDKGLLPFHGKPLVAHVLERLQPQVTEILLNANREIEAYQAFGYPVISDAIGGFAGPLAGLHSGMSVAKTPLVVTVPCDSPFLPADLAQRLLQAMEKHQADLAVAKTGDQPHPVFCLCRTSLLPGLTRFLESGGRKIDAWYAGLNAVEVPFDDEADAFANFNTPAELEAAA